VSPGTATKKEIQQDYIKIRIESKIQKVALPPMNISALAVSILLALVHTSSAFSPIYQHAAATARPLTTTQLHDTSPTKGEEKTMRKELMEKQTTLPKGQEKKYGVLDGADMEGAFRQANVTDVAVTTTPEERADSLEAKIERMTKPRAYPLFVAEKVAEIAEGIVGKVFKSTKAPVKKEKIVVLGTGWGASAFLKDIDTDLYDVTIISPRNYFLFTPVSRPPALVLNMIPPSHCLTCKCTIS
jgi:hypothetical protein